MRKAKGVSVRDLALLVLSRTEPKSASVSQPRNTAERGCFINGTARRSEWNASRPHPEPLDVDYDLAELLGVAGSRREFLGAVELVVHLGDEPWPEAEALAALARWWGQDLDTLTAVQWIVGAAHADEVRAMAGGCTG